MCSISGIHLIDLYKDTSLALCSSDLLSQFVDWVSDILLCDETQCLNLFIFEHNIPFAHTPHTHYLEYCVGLNGATVISGTFSFQYSTRLSNAFSSSVFGNSCWSAM